MEARGTREFYSSFVKTLSKALQGLSAKASSSRVAIATTYKLLVINKSKFVNLIPSRLPRYSLVRHPL